MERLTCTIPEAARVLGVSRSKMYELVRSEAIDSIKLGKRRLVAVHSLREFVGLPREGPMPGAAAEPPTTQTSTAVPFDVGTEEVSYIVTIRRLKPGERSRLTL